MTLSPRRISIFNSVIFILSVVLFLSLSMSLEGQTKSTESSADSHYNVLASGQEFDQRKANLLKGYRLGYRIISLSDKRKMAVWYPTSSKVERYVYKIGESLVRSKLALNGILEPGKYPVVFYCHGAVGCGLSSFFLTEAIARKGYIVAAPDFSDKVYASRIDQVVPSTKEKTKIIWNYLYSLRDNGLDNNAELGRTKFSYRPLELRQAMDYLLNLDKDTNSIFHNHIDTTKIGILGHSFGAWTGILVSGAEPKYTRYGIGALAYLSGPSNKNVYRVASDNDLAKVHCPVMFQYGACEKLFSNRQDDQYLFAKANSPKYLACIANCNHFTFSCGSGKQFGTASDYISKSVPRTVICDLVIGFFDRYLKSAIKPSSYINEKTEGVEIFKSSFLESSQPKKIKMQELE